MRALWLSCSFFGGEIRLVGGASCGSVALLLASSSFGAFPFRVGGSRTRRCAVLPVILQNGSRRSCKFCLQASCANQGSSLSVHLLRAMRSRN